MMTDHIRAAGVANVKSPGILFGESVRSDQPETMKPFDDTVHGISSKKSESVGRCFPRVTGFQSKLRDMDEEIYWSRKNEPLGRRKMTSNPLPPSTHVYGKVLPVDGSVSDAFKGVPEETEPDRQLYKHTHRDFDPGEQVDRNYKWPHGVDDTFAFGLRELKSQPIDSCMKWEEHESSPIPERRAPTVYHPRIKKVEPMNSAAWCINGNFKTVDELLPDPTIGKSPNSRVHA